MALTFTRNAAKALRKIPADDAARIIAGLEEVAANGLPHPRVTKLVNSPSYRLRHGDWRALFDLEGEPQDVFCFKVAHRREAYE